MNDRMWINFYEELNKLKDPDIPNWRNLPEEEYQKWLKEIEKQKIKQKMERQKKIENERNMP